MPDQSVFLKSSTSCVYEGILRNAKVPFGESNDTFYARRLNELPVPSTSPDLPCGTGPEVKHVIVVTAVAALTSSTSHRSAEQVIAATWCRFRRGPAVPLECHVAYRRAAVGRV